MTRRCTDTELGHRPARGTKLSLSTGREALTFPSFHARQTHSVRGLDATFTRSTFLDAIDERVASTASGAAPISQLIRAIPTWARLRRRMKLLNAHVAIPSSLSGYLDGTWA